MVTIETDVYIYKKLKYEAIQTRTMNTHLNANGSKKKNTFLVWFEQDANLHLWYQLLSDFISDLNYILINQDVIHLNFRG